MLSILGLAQRDDLRRLSLACQSSDQPQGGAIPAPPPVEANPDDRQGGGVFSHEVEGELRPGFDQPGTRQRRRYGLLLRSGQSDE
jgi:hypothetical protein